MRRRAACVGMVSRGLDIWFPETRAEADEAKRICGLCPVAAECAVDAAAAGDWISVRGGMTGPERKRWAYERGLPRHGTSTGYTKDRCRCQLCRDAITDEKRRWRERKAVA